MRFSFLPPKTSSETSIGTIDDEVHTATALWPRRQRRSSPPQDPSKAASAARPRQRKTGVKAALLKNRKRKAADAYGDNDDDGGAATEARLKVLAAADLADVACFGKRPTVECKSVQ